MGELILRIRRGDKRLELVISVCEQNERSWSVPRQYRPQFGSYVLKHLQDLLLSWHYFFRCRFLQAGTGAVLIHLHGIRGKRRRPEERDVF